MPMNPDPNEEDKMQGYNQDLDDMLAIIDRLQEVEQHIANMKADVRRVMEDYSGNVDFDRGAHKAYADVLATINQISLLYGKPEGSDSAVVEAARRYPHEPRREGRKAPDPPRA